MELFFSLPVYPFMPVRHSLCRRRFLPRYPTPGTVVTLPAPYTADLVFPANTKVLTAPAPLNPDAEKAFRDETKPITDFERAFHR
jgi:hypothetical protein